MSFQAYMDNIQAKTGLSPDQIAALATEKGLLRDGRIADGVKATQITDWLKADLGLGHGHASAMFAYFKGKRD